MDPIKLLEKAAEKVVEILHDIDKYERDQGWDGDWVLIVWPFAMIAFLLVMIFAIPLSLLVTLYQKTFKERYLRKEHAPRDRILRKTVKSEYKIIKQETNSELGD